MAITTTTTPIGVEIRDRMIARYWRYTGCHAADAPDPTAAVSIESLADLWAAKFGTHGRTTQFRMMDSPTTGPFDAMFDEISTAVFFINAYRRLQKAGHFRFEHAFSTDELLWKL